METILPAYDDPLFSILLIISIALIISMVTYGWGVYKQQKEQENLLKFLEKFDSSECSLDTSEMQFDPHMLKPLALLAHAFDNAGEYHKAIGIYLYLIKNISQDHLKIEFMEKLGSTYFHAGFLERARNIFEEILRQKPRNTKVLNELGIVYERMHNFLKAKEVIEPLDMLGEETHFLKAFLAFSELVWDKAIDLQTKTEKLSSLLESQPQLYRETVAALFRLDTHKAWQAVDASRLEELIDILWFLPLSQVSLDIITMNERLSTLYYAKGYLHQPFKSSSIFALDLLATAKENGFEDGDLHFTYLCKKCKQSFPVSFKRCPNCMALHTLKVEEHIAKADSETDYSLF